MNTLLLAGILAYVVAQFVIGAWVSRRVDTEQDYILAGRSLGPMLVAFSVFATWFGAEAIVASAGEIYAKGLAGSITDPFGYGGAVLLVGLLLAAPLWRRGIVTYADMMRTRFAPAVEKVFVIVLLPGSVLWAAAQIRAFGQILAAETGMGLGTGILVAAVLVGGYSIVGGLLADAITDVVQGVAVIAGLVALTLFVVWHFGGVGAALSSIAPERLSFAAGDDGPWVRIEKLAVVICGSLVAVELVSRFLGARTAAIASGGTVAGGMMYMALGLLPMFLGLVGPGLVPTLDEPEQIIPKLAEAHLPPLARALFIGALISAILSVVHAALHAPAAQLSHNVVLRYLPGLSPHARLTSVRIAVLGLSIVAWALARTVDTIKELVELASAFGSAGAMVAALFGLFTGFGGPYAALAALLTGSFGWALARFWLGLSTPYLVALAGSLVVYVAVGAWEGRGRAAAP